jgi:hypothetical protein
MQRGGTRWLILCVQSRSTASEVNMAGDIVLPEITIEGDARSSPQNASDWWANGFTFGYNSPDATAERPLMINDELAAMFLLGAQSGRRAARETADAMAALIDQNPAIQEDLGGQSLDRVREQFNRDFGSLFHSEHAPHPPHDEPAEILDPLPLPNLVLVE